MRKSRFNAVIAVILLLGGISVSLRGQDQKSPNLEERAKVVNVVRLINTAEARYLGSADSNGRYASWDELYKSGIVKTLQERPFFRDVQVSSGPEVIPGYRLDLMVSAGGKAYSLALHDTKKGDHLFSAFSDQNGVIFLGSPLE